MIYEVKNWELQKAGKQPGHDVFKLVAIFISEVFSLHTRPAHRNYCRVPTDAVGDLLGINCSSLRDIWNLKHEGKRKIQSLSNINLQSLRGLKDIVV